MVWVLFAFSILQLLTAKYGIHPARIKYLFPLCPFSDEFWNSVARNRMMSMKLLLCVKLCTSWSPSPNKRYVNFLWFKPQGNQIYISDQFLHILHASDEENYATLLLSSTSECTCSSAPEANWLLDEEAGWTHKNVALWKSDWKYNWGRGLLYPVIIMHFYLCKFAHFTEYYHKLQAVYWLSWDIIVSFLNLKNIRVQ